jgi:hypothetical protein
MTATDALMGLDLWNLLLDISGLFERRDGIWNGRHLSPLAWRAVQRALRIWIKRIVL